MGKSAALSAGLDSVVVFSYSTRLLCDPGSVSWQCQQRLYNTRITSFYICCYGEAFNVIVLYIKGAFCACFT